MRNASAPTPRRRLERVGAVAPGRLVPAVGDGDVDRSGPTPTLGRCDTASRRTNRAATRTNRRAGRATSGPDTKDSRAHFELTLTCANPDKARLHLYSAIIRTLIFFFVADLPSPSFRKKDAAQEQFVHLPLSPVSPGPGLGGLRQRPQRLGDLCGAEACLPQGARWAPTLAPGDGFIGFYGIPREVERASRTWPVVQDGATRRALQSTGSFSWFLMRGWQCGTSTRGVSCFLLARVRGRSSVVLRHRERSDIEWPKPGRVSRSNEGPGVVERRSLGRGLMGEVWNWVSVPHQHSAGRYRKIDQHHPP